MNTAEFDQTMIAAGLITTCREEVEGERCDEPAEFILWGKLLAPEALGPRCYQHAVEHTANLMPQRSNQWAVADLRPIRDMASPAREGDIGR